MEGSGDVWVQLATRIPKSLHRDLKLHCVTAEQSVMDFVVQALQEKLGRSQGRRRAAK
jgi:predicted HicB family RNase H-like nuclease